jgi:hypothetical protein
MGAVNVMHTTGVGWREQSVHRRYGLGNHGDSGREAVTVIGGSATSTMTTRTAAAEDACVTPGWSLSTSANGYGANAPRLLVSSSHTEGET